MLLGAERPLSAEEISQAVGASLDGTQRLLAACSGLQLLNTHQDDGRGRRSDFPLYIMITRTSPLVSVLCACLSLSHMHKRWNFVWTPAVSHCQSSPSSSTSPSTCAQCFTVTQSRPAFTWPAPVLCPSTSLSSTAPEPSTSAGTTWPTLSGQYTDGHNFTVERVHVTFISIEQWSWKSATNDSKLWMICLFDAIVITSPLFP